MVHVLPRRALIVCAAIAACVACGKNTTAPSSTLTINIAPGASLQTIAAFGMNPVEISSGTVVTWTNTDTLTHTSTSDSGIFDSGLITRGASYSFSFNTAGTYTYHCSNHPGMVGTIVVH